jgi:hypothetical protein
MVQAVMADGGEEEGIERGRIGAHIGMGKARDDLTDTRRTGSLPV